MDRATLARCVLVVTEAHEQAKLAPTMPAAADIMEAAVLKVIELHEAALWQHIGTLPQEGEVMLADDHGRSLTIFTEHYTHCEGDPDWTKWRHLPEAPEAA